MRPLRRVDQLMVAAAVVLVGGLLVLWAGPRTFVAPRLTSGPVSGVSSDEIAIADVTGFPGDAAVLHDRPVGTFQWTVSFTNEGRTAITLESIDWPDDGYGFATERVQVSHDYASPGSWEEFVPMKLERGETTTLRATIHADFPSRGATFSWRNRLTGDFRVWGQVVKVEVPLERVIVVSPLDTPALRRTIVDMR